MHSTRVDGNALEGMLGGLFGDDPTMLEAACGGCGSTFRLAEVVVELDDVCGIAMCRRCTHTLFTVLRDGDSIRIAFAGLASLSG